VSSSIMTNERLVELLVQQATEGGLTPKERSELNQLLREKPYSDVNEFEYTVAALQLAAVNDDEPLPASLRARLFRQADQFSQAPLAPVAKIAPRREAKSSNNIAWFAAAASVVLAVAGWWPRLAVEPVAAVPPPPPTLAQLREQMAAQPTVIKREWTATQDASAAGVKGDVVWDPQAQRGYMRFQGLAANDARLQQYQLWIFDATRGDKYPVDGGVFDIPPNSTEVVVPIQARLPVGQAAMFAVTLERAGGAVVSEREHILVLAKTASGQS
jgi:anti-sigma-K factor RskA